jgi:RNA polymerase sigma-70 factor, ECF subfamily
MDALRLPDLRRVSDNDLLEAAMGRDGRAWQELLRRYRPLIFRCILRVVKRYGAQLSTEDVDEIFGDVCVSILHNDMHKLRAWDPARGARLGSWLGLLAINVTHDHLRQVSRRPHVVRLEPARDPDGDAIAEQPAPEPSALDRLLEQERRSMLRHLLRDFSLRDRRFVELYYGAGLSPEEVAAQMGISVKTVYSKKNKVRTRLLRLVARLFPQPQPQLAFAAA